MTSPLKIGEFLKESIFSSREAAGVLQIEHGRLQTWLNRGLVPYQKRDLGPRRLLRRFTGYDLAAIAMMVELIDKHGIDVADASAVADAMTGEAALKVMMVDHPDFAKQTNHDVTKPRPSYWTIANGEVGGCYGIDTINEARERLGNPDAFTVFDAEPTMKRALTRALDALKAKLAAEAKTE